MEKYDLLVIGFGKAGKTLAAKLAAEGKKVAVIEADSAMYGGTCINIGCIPTKTMLVAAHSGKSYAEVKATRDAVVTKLNQKNYHMLADNSNITVYNATAKFIKNKEVQITVDGTVKQLSAEIIVINTGAKSNVLPIKGLTSAKQVYDSTGLQMLEKQPQRLGILGGGNIGLEFAGLYARLGSAVSVIDMSPAILTREEPEVAALAKEYMENQGVSFYLDTATTEVFNRNDAVIVRTEKYGELEFDALLYATGRVPNLADLGLENTDITFTNRGIVVDENCMTNVENVYAVGDVKGGLQFTYISLNDFRKVYRAIKAKEAGQKAVSVPDGAIPYTTFITPPLSRIGLTEKDAREQGYHLLVKTLPVANMPRGAVNQDPRGLFKAVVDQNSRQILGVTLFGRNSEELINLIKMAMDHQIPYTYLRDQIFTHPTMAENLNDLFNL